MNKCVVKGQAASLKWVYMPVARLGPWTIDGGRLTAEIVSCDTFLASQQPVTFVVNRPSGTAWEWSLESLQIAGSTLTATVLQE